MACGVIPETASEEDGAGGEQQGEAQAVGYDGADGIGALRQVGQDPDGDGGGRNAA